MTIFYDDLILNGNIQELITKSTTHIEQKLENMPYAQALVHKYYDKDGYLILSILQSYSTLVCAIDFNSNTIYCNGTYSQTTRKHIGSFARQFSGHTGFNSLSYYDFKEAVDVTEGIYYFK